MAMTTENEKKDTGAGNEPDGINKDVGATIKQDTETPAAQAAPDPVEVPVEKQKPVENFAVLKSAIIYIAQHELDPAGFQDFKNLYPSLFE